MAWYRTGTVSVTNGSTTVTGSGTNFVAGAQVGEGFAAPDGRLYEIVTIVSATSLTIGKAYLGSTQTGQTYEIVPTQSLVADLAGQVSTLISDFQSVADEAGEGKFDYGTAASPGITFTLDQDTGFFHDTNNEIGVSAGGTKVAEFNSGGLSFPSGKGVAGNADFAGNINLSQASNTTIKRDDNTGFLSIQGGTDALSTSLVMYGNAHATLPNWTILEADTMVFRTVDNTDFMRFVDGTGAVFNENSADHDFRIESDTNTHAFFLQGSDGNVGIGTGSPAEKLEVTGNIILDATDANIKIKSGVAGTAGAVNFTFNSDSTVYGSLSLPYDTRSSVGLLAQSANAYPVSIASGTASSATNAVILSTSGEEAMRVTYLGRVGIGDSAPPTILSVRGDTPESRITNTNTISDTIGTEEVARLGVYGQKNNVYGPAANIVFRQDASTWSFVDQYNKGTRIEFCTQDATATDTSETPRMVINKDGSVGIGTASPVEPLHVSRLGGADATLPAFDGNTAIVTTPGGTTTSSGSAITIHSNVSGSSSINFSDTNDADIGRISYSHSADSMLINVNNSERMRITSSGNVGIGTSDPTNALDVNSDSIRVRTSQTPATAGATGNQGEIAWDADYIYICVATNTWKRVAISTW
jgi:hypothetical protein